MKRTFTINRHLMQRIGFTAITLMAVATVLPIVAVVIYIFLQVLSPQNKLSIQGSAH